VVKKRHSKSDTKIKKQLSKKISQKNIDVLSDIFNALLSVELFSELTREELMEFSTIVKREDVNAGKVITREGDKKSNLYIIDEGIVEISKKTSLGEPYVISIRDVKKTGRTFFGEVSLIYNTPRTATIIAKTDAVLYNISGHAFNKFCDDNQLVGYKIMKILIRDICKYLRSSNEQVLILFDALVEETKRGIET